MKDDNMIYQDELGNKFDLTKIEDVSTIIDDMFAGTDDKIQCDCVIANLESLIKRSYKRRMLELGITKNRMKRRFCRIWELLLQDSPMGFYVGILQ